MIVAMHIIYILFENVPDIISPNNLLNSFSDTLLKLKVLYWHQCFYDPLTTIEFSIYKVKKSVFILLKRSSTKQNNRKYIYLNLLNLGRLHLHDYK